MRNRGIEKYPDELRQKAIQKMEMGEGTLSSISKEIGVPKTTVKYWLDNAEKFGAVGNGKGRNSRAVSLQKKIYEYGWGLVYRLIKTANANLEQGTPLDQIKAANELTKGLISIKNSGVKLVNDFKDPMANGSSGTQGLEVTEAYEKKIKLFVEKNQEAETSGKREGVNSDEDNQGEHRPPPQQIHDAEVINEEPDEQKKQINEPN